MTPTRTFVSHIFAPWSHLSRHVALQRALRPRLPDASRMKEHWSLLARYGPMSLASADYWSSLTGRCVRCLQHVFMSTAVHIYVYVYIYTITMIRYLEYAILQPFLEYAGYNFGVYKQNQSNTIGIRTFFKFYQLETLEKTRKMERKYKNTSGHPQKINMSITVGSELGKRNGCPKLSTFWLHFTLKEGGRLDKDHPHECNHWQTYHVHPCSM